jgi:hypothetical protein
MHVQAPDMDCVLKIYQEFLICFFVYHMGLLSALTREEYFCYREFLALLAKYKFVIAIENAVCEDYVTEKLWRALHLGAVPLYLGRLPNFLIFLFR